MHEEDVKEAVFARTWGIASKSRPWSRGITPKTRCPPALPVHYGLFLGSYFGRQHQSHCGTSGSSLLNSSAPRLCSCVLGRLSCSPCLFSF